MYTAVMIWRVKHCHWFTPTSNLEELRETDEFRNLDSLQVREIIGSEDLVIEGEKIVLKAFIDWY